MCASYGGALHCTINDVVLATVTEALRRYLFRRRVDASTLDFRVSIPVNTRAAEHAKQMGNHVSTWIIRLPLDQKNPLDQIDAIRVQTAERKQSNSALALDTVMKAAEYLPVGLLRRGVGLVQGQVNTIVTNVPRPQFPLYTVGARLLGMYPIVPLIPGCGLGIALFSYEGKLCWGLNADHHLIPNLEDFTKDLGIAFETLRKAAVTRFLSLRTAPSEQPDSPARAQARPSPEPEPVARVESLPRPRSRNPARAGAVAADAVVPP